MANFCRFCGKPLVNGQCDCPGFQAAQQPAAPAQQPQRTQPMFATSQTAQPRPAAPQQSPQAAPGEVQAMFSAPSPQPGNTGKSILMPFGPLNTASAADFFASIRDRSGMNTSPAVDNVYERGVPIIPDCVDAQEGEQVVRQYEIAKLRSRLILLWAEARLMVTDKRLILRSAGASFKGNLVSQQQFDLEEIKGVELNKGHRFNLLNFVAGLLMFSAVYALLSLLLGIVGLSMYISGSHEALTTLCVLLGLACLVPSCILYRRFWLKLLCSGAGAAMLATSLSLSYSGLLLILYILAQLISLINLIIISFVPSLTLTIKTRAAGPAVVLAGHLPGLRNRGGIATEVLPWNDTDAAIRELGTLVQELRDDPQTAVNKWKTK